MTKMTEISRYNLGVLGREFELALKDLGDKFGLKIRAAGGVYGGAQGVVKMSVEVQDNGAGVSGKESEFRALAPIYGLQPDDFGKVLTFRGERYKLIGIKRGSPKFTMEVERVSDRRQFKMTTSMVKDGLQTAKLLKVA